MRVNIYEEEVTGEVERLERSVPQGPDGELVDFVGVRVYLHSPAQLHKDQFDDDRSAVTFWFRKGHEDTLAYLFETAEEVVGV